MIEDIVLNPREEINGPRHGEDGVVWLQYPPAIILFHPFHSEFAGVIVDIGTMNKFPVTPFVAYVDELPLALDKYSDTCDLWTNLSEHFLSVSDHF
jgi:hypothetical protein